MGNAKQKLKAIYCNLKLTLFSWPNTLKIQVQNNTCAIMARNAKATLQYDRVKWQNPVCAEKLHSCAAISTQGGFCRRTQVVLKSHSAYI